MYKKIIGVAIAAVLLTGLAGCSYDSDEGDAYQERKEKSQAYDTDDSLELKNLEEKRSREDDPNKIRYVYVMSYATIIGYYVAEGKISSSASQIAPESELIRPKYKNGGYDDFMIVESAKDDGSYGPGDPGIFFFTTEGAMIETSLDYIVSDVPMTLDVPRLVE